MQFYLEVSDQEELEALPRIGPTLEDSLICTSSYDLRVPEDCPSDKAVWCYKRKLEFDGFHVDTVMIWQSDLGVDAFTFQVGDLFEVFGKISDDSVATELKYSED